MDYEISWLIEDEVIHVLQLREWTLEVGAQMIRDASVMMESIPKAKVPIVVDARRVPGRFYNLLEAHRMFKDNRSPKWGFTIVLESPNPIIFIGKAVLNIAQVELKIVKDHPEALQILYRLDPPLADKPVNLPPSDG